jgi:8-oxo-dGTP diphosphatase
MSSFKHTVAAIIRGPDNLYLIGKEVAGNHEYAGCWYIPGGHMRPGETPEQAVVREMKEETGLNIEIEEQLEQHLHPNSDGTVSLLTWFVCRAPHARARPSDDLVEIKWVTKHEVAKQVDPRAVERWPPKVRAFFGV